MTTRMKISIGVLVVLCAMQLVPLERSNPPVSAEVPASAEVRQILKRACYDCHSHETRWPWYAWVAPVSFLVVHDVHEAREHVNFSAWDTYTESEKAHNLEEAWEEVEAGVMPLWFYVPLHPDAELSDADMQALRDWANAGGHSGKAPAGHPH